MVSVIQKPDPVRHTITGNRIPVFIGIDGGGTKTRAVAIGYDGRLICEMGGRSANVAVSGVDTTFENLKMIFDGLVQKISGSERLGINAVLGLAGISDAGDRLSTALLNKLYSLNFMDNIRLVNDAYIAWYGIDRGNPAIALISGTGSASFTVGPEGKTVVKGGMGHILSDEGSGYHIGLMGVRRAIRAAKRMESDTSLTGKVMEVFSLKSIDEAPYLIKEHVEIAAFARHVYEASLAGDSIACEIIEQAADELARLALATWRDGGFRNKQVKIGMFGSCLEKMTTLRSALQSRLQLSNNKLVVTDPVWSPVLAAAQLARNTLPQPDGRYSIF